MKEIEGVECRFAIHVPQSFKHPDVHYVVKLVHYKDGSKEKVISKVENYKRPIWITKPEYRNHEQKKEYEELHKLKKIESTQSKLQQTIAKALDLKVNLYGGGGKVDSPYVYGTDSTTESLIKREFKDKYPNVSFTPFSICCFDIEADIYTGEITVLSASRDKEVYVAVNSAFLYTDEMRLQKYKFNDDDKEKYKERIKQLWLDNLPRDATEGVELIIDICRDELEAIINIFKHIHSKRPDYLAIWNMDYDIKKLIERMEVWKQKDPKRCPGIETLFSDPKLPSNYHHFEYVEDQAQKVTASGKVTNKAQYELWNYVIAPASFICLDNMQVYYRCRLNQPKVPGGYGLDNILEKNLGTEYMKPKFSYLEDISRLKGVDWHKAMSSRHKLEYIVYNMWDTYAMVMLDKKTRNLSVSIPTTCAETSIRILHQQPKILVDKIHQFYLKHNQVLANRSKTPVEFDLLGREDWTVTAQMYKIRPNKAMYCIKENPNLKSNVVFHVGDADQASGYPSNQSALNASFKTLQREIISISRGDYQIPRLTVMKQNMSFLYGKASMVEYMNKMCNAPSIRELLTGVLEDTVDDNFEELELEELEENTEEEE